MPKSKNPTFVGFHAIRMVGYSGFEPLTSSMSSRFEAETRKDGQ